MPVHAAQPWDCSSRTHAVYQMDRTTPCPWMAKVESEFYPAKYLFTVDYTDSEIADDPAQHKQSHVLELLDAGRYTGNLASDIDPSQHIHYSKSDLDYTLDVNRVFDNLYNDSSEEEVEDNL